MNDYVMGYNRSVINKEDVLYGKKMVTRHLFIFDYLMGTLVFVTFLSTLSLYESMEPSIRILLLTVSISVLLLYSIQRIRAHVLTTRLIHAQFETKKDITFHFTFYQYMMNVDIYSIEGKKSCTLSYENLEYIHYDLQLVVIKCGIDKKFYWFNPLFLKDVTIHQLCDQIKKSNPKVKISGVM